MNVWETWTLVSWIKWRQFLRIGNLILEFQILEDKRFGRSEALVVEPVCEGGRWGLNELLVSSER